MTKTDQLIESLGDIAKEGIKTGINIQHGKNIQKSKNKNEVLKKAKKARKIIDSKGNTSCDSMRSHLFKEYRNKDSG